MQPSRVLLIIAAALMLEPAMAQTSLSVREALAAVMPVALEVVVEIETETGQRLSDEDLQALLASPDFERRIAIRVRGNPEFSPCRIEFCLHT
jgi:hypothetical protein